MSWLSMDYRIAAERASFSDLCNDAVGIWEVEVLLYFPFYLGPAHVVIGFFEMELCYVAFCNRGWKERQ